MIRRNLFLAVALCACLVFLGPHSVTAGTFELLSIGADGSAADGGSNRVVISGDGRYVAYSSYATNIIDDGYQCDYCTSLYLLDRQTGQIRRIAQPTYLYDLSISGDGRYVVYSTGAEYPYIYDNETGSTTSPDLSQYGITGKTRYARISSDGTHLAFAKGYNYLQGVQDCLPGLFMLDLQSGIPDCVKYKDNKSTDTMIHEMSITGDGGILAFRFGNEYSNNRYIYGKSNLYAYDFKSGKSHFIVKGSKGVGKKFYTGAYPSLSSDGGYMSYALYVTPGMTREIFVTNLSGGKEESLGAGFRSRLSGDGRYVALHTSQPNSNFCCALSVHDRYTGTSEHLVDRVSNYFDISDDGRYIVFSTADALVPEDTNGTSDIYTYEVYTETTQ